MVPILWNRNSYFVFNILKNMKEQDLIDLGFERHDHDEEGVPFYYYCYDLNGISGGGSLISDSSDTVDSDDAWEVYAWDINENLVFDNKEDIKIYIDVLERNINTSDKD
jgi:hypothetical protein